MEIADNQDQAVAGPARRWKPSLGKLKAKLSMKQSRDSFDFEQYLRTRTRSPLEARFHEEIQSVSHGAMTVEDVQRLCNEVHSKVEAMRVLLMRLDLKGHRETDRFTQHFSRIWRNTPRSDLGGAWPAEQIREESAHSKPVQVGRNDPCTCGSGAKFKNCCG